MPTTNAIEPGGLRSANPTCCTEVLEHSGLGRDNQEGLRRKGVKLTFFKGFANNTVYYTIY